MTSEFLEGAVSAPRSAASAPDPDAARIRRLVEELLEMVAAVREQAAELERERDALRIQLAEVVEGRADRARSGPAASGPEPAGEGRVGRGDMRAALAGSLAGEPRRRGALVALLGGADG